MARVEGLEPPFSAPITISGLEDHLGYTRLRLSTYPTDLIVSLLYQ